MVAQPLPCSAHRLERHIDVPIGDSEEIQVITERSDRSPARPVTIWVVRFGDNLYVRSGYGADGSWFRRASARPHGAVRAGRLQWPVRFEPADASLTAEIDAAYRGKYHRYPPAILDAMVSPSAAATTLRPHPAGG